MSDGALRSNAARAADQPAGVCFLSELAFISSVIVGGVLNGGGVRNKLDFMVMSYDAMTQFGDNHQSLGALRYRER